MAHSARLSSAGAADRPRLRGIAAAAAVVVFFGAAATAPLSVSGAFADDGRASLMPRQDQGIVSAAAEPMLDVEVSELRESGAGGEASRSSEKRKPSKALYTLERFLFSGVVNWGGYRFTYYSQQVLPGSGLQIPGRHVNEGGYVADADGYIVLAGDAPKGTVFETPFGYPGKIYDRGTFGNHLDVYIR